MERGVDEACISVIFSQGTWWIRRIVVAARSARYVSIEWSCRASHCQFDRVFDMLQSLIEHIGLTVG